MRYKAFVLLSVLMSGSLVAAGSMAQQDQATDSIAGKLQVQIQSPADDFVVSDGTTVVDVEGVASSIGGVQYLDMIFVLDTSSSLRQTDPKDYRSLGAVGLVENLSPRSNVKIGVVSFAGRGQLVQPMTSDRGLVAEALRQLPRSGSTDLAAGIRMAVQELNSSGRPGSSRVIMLFTDGMSNERKAFDATIAAQKQGVVIQSLLLGSNTRGTSILDTIAWATGGSFVRVDDPSKLPEAFLNLRTTGVESVTLSVNGSAPVPANLAGGTFAGSVSLGVGENRIVALATSLEGETRESIVNVTVQDASCAALQVAALKQGRSVISLNDRAVEIVVDASRSMWGQIYGEAKMSIAKNILQDVSYWFPEDLDLALRAYGSMSPSESNNCGDSTLLVPFGDRNRAPIRAAISGLRPTGQTPIAFALDQAAADFGSRQSDRAVVLVTDGIESCGGNPVRAARELSARGITVHVIGFGLGNAADEDTASLRAIADASGGRYVVAGSAEELKEALAQTVATSFSVYKGNTVVANGSLGANETMYLPEGKYRVELHSSPPQVVPVELAPRDRVRLTLEKRGDVVSHFQRRDSIEYRSCQDPVSVVTNQESP
ncbi:MAG: VWA domain-containing protein [Woeseiaceae bacterium]|nr:VWA domain-containing protein [Woeseiaceae bacterium]